MLKRSLLVLATLPLSLPALGATGTIERIDDTGTTGVIKDLGLGVSLAFYDPEAGGLDLRPGSFVEFSRVGRGDDVSATDLVPLGADGRDVGLIDGVFDGDLRVQNGQTVIVSGTGRILGGADVRGGELILLGGVEEDVRVVKGGSLEVDGGEIGGKVDVKASALAEIEGAIIGGDVKIKDTAEVIISDSRLDGRLSVSGGSIELHNDTVDSFVDLDSDNDAYVDLVESGGSLRITGGGDLSLTGAISSLKEIHVHTSGDVTLDGSLEAPEGVKLRTGDAKPDGEVFDVGSLHLRGVITSDRDVDVVAGQDLTLDGLTVSALGDVLLRTGPAGGRDEIGWTGGTWTGTGETRLEGRNVSLVGGAALTFAGVAQADEEIRVRAGISQDEGALTLTGDLRAGGDVRVHSDGTVTLKDNFLHGQTVYIRAKGAVDLSDTSLDGGVQIGSKDQIAAHNGHFGISSLSISLMAPKLRLAGTSFGGPSTLTADEELSVTDGDFLCGGTHHFRTAGIATLTGGAFDGELHIEAGGDLELSDTDLGGTRSVTLTTSAAARISGTPFGAAVSISSDGSVAVVSGAIAPGGSVQIGALGSVSLTDFAQGADALTLSSGGLLTWSTTQTKAPLMFSGSRVNLKAGGDVKISGDIKATQDLDLNAAGAATLQGAAGVAGSLAAQNLTVHAGGDLLLISNPVAQGTLSLTSGGKATVRSTRVMALDSDVIMASAQGIQLGGAVQAGGDLRLSGGEGSISTSTDAALSSGGDALLDGVGIDFDTVTLTVGGNVELKDAGSTTLGSATVGGAMEAIVEGDMTFLKPVTVKGQASVDVGGVVYGAQNLTAGGGILWGRWDGNAKD